MAQTRPTDSDAFFAMARRLSLLDEEAIGKLDTQRVNADVSTSELALRSGLLDAVQIDIVETLLAPEEVVPGFQILDLIAQGGMGVVYRARQMSLDRIVAVKTILVSQMHDQSTLARFEQEAVAVARLRHPNIVAAYDFGRHLGRLFFVMELIEGDDVQRTIEKEGHSTKASPGNSCGRRPPDFRTPRWPASFIAISNLRICSWSSRRPASSCRAA
jgi:serine/threonine protein kinase